MSFYFGCRSFFLIRYLSNLLSVYLSIYLSIYPSAIHLPAINLSSIHLSINRSIYIYTYTIPFVPNPCSSWFNLPLFFNEKNMFSVRSPLSNAALLTRNGQRSSDVSAMPQVEFVHLKDWDSWRSFLG